MTLEQYLQRKKIRPSAFAAKIGKSPSLITRLLDGSRRPSLDTARAIAKETKGAVSFEDWPKSAAGGEAA